MTFGQWVKYIFLTIFTPGSCRRMEWQMLIFLNKDRKGFGLKKLFMQEDLRNVARRHSKDMAVQDYFDHKNLEGYKLEDRLRISRITEAVSGENLAKIGGYGEPTLEAQVGLMKSPGHKANILNKSYNCVGVGIYKSRDGVYYFTQNFAKRLVKFVNGIRKRVNVKKGLSLRGFVFGEVEKLYYRVRYDEETESLESGYIPLHEGEFDYRIMFEETGRYNVLIYCITKGRSSKMKLTNSFSVKVKSFWF